MNCGIAVVGLNGSGKSTLAHALAKQLHCFEADVEDYYFPGQKAARKWSMEHEYGIETDVSAALPFAESRTQTEVRNAIASDLRRHPSFVLSGVSLDWNDEILSRIHIVFWLRVSLEERLKRIQSREEKRFGARVREGGDLFAQQRSFRQMVKERTESKVTDSLTGLS